MCNCLNARNNLYIFFYLPLGFSLWKGVKISKNRKINTIQIKFNCLQSYNVKRLEVLHQSSLSILTCLLTLSIRNRHLMKLIIIKHNVSAQGIIQVSRTDLSAYQLLDKELLSNIRGLIKK